MNRQTGFVAISCISVLLAGALSGCNSQTSALSNGRKQVSAAATVSNESTADSAAARQALQSAADAGTKDKMQISSTPDSQGLQQNSLSTPDASKAHVADKDAYRHEKPTLLGLSLGTLQNDVLAKLGKSKSTFMMDDDTDPVTVYEYGEYSVGFNHKGTLEFVDIHSPDIDPGLHGLRLGRKAEDAFQALGKPDMNSTYVLAYISKGTILKLDLDPKSRIIRSIKLFPSP